MAYADDEHHFTVNATQLRRACLHWECPRAFCAEPPPGPSWATQEELLDLTVAGAVGIYNLLRDRYDGK